MNILVLGVGAIGSHLAANLAVDLPVHHVTVLDRDNIEERNVRAGTQFYMRDQIGQPKVEALQYNIYKWYGKTIDIIHSEFKPYITANWPPLYDLVVDCFDNTKARDEARIYTLKKTPLLHVGFSDFMTYAIEWDENYKTPDNEVKLDICEMQGAASFVKQVASVASLTIQDFLATGKKRDFVGNKFSVHEL
jgi:molybdopterin/thiamine biosynthesis adenylyltransferase